MNENNNSNTPWSTALENIAKFANLLKSYALKWYDMYFNPTPKDVEVDKIADDSDELTPVTVPNLAKIKQTLFSWMENVEKTIGYALTCTGYIKTSYTLADMKFDTAKVTIGSGGYASTDKPGALSFSKEGGALTIENGRAATFRIKLLAMFCGESEYESGLYDISFGSTATVACDSSGNVTVTQDDIKTGIILVRTETDAETGNIYLYTYLWPGFVNSNPDIDAYIPRVSMGTAQIISRS